MSSAAYAHTRTNAAAITKPSLWTGRTLSALAVAFLLFDTIIKLVQLAPVVEAFRGLDMPVSLAPAIGTLQLVLLVLYVVPRSSILGAVLLTGFLGGATALHVRVGSPLFSHVLFPAYVGALLWGGLLLRDARLRALVSSRHSD